MSPLRLLLEKKIRTNGPLKISAFMELCLFHPHHGYYKNSLPLGKTGDFITAPEISQLFGEIIGLYFVDQWQKMASPLCLNFIEFGPGNGTLLRDIMRIFQKFSLLKKTRFFLLEINPLLIQKQKELCLPLSRECQWFDDISSLLKALPLHLTFFVGNEFLDVFPIDQYIFKGKRWWERRIGIESDHFIIKEVLCEDSILPFPKNPSPNAIFEISSQQKDFFQKLLLGLKELSFSGLFIDYGYEEGQGDSLQAVSHHSFSNIFDKIGEQDLTAHVNFKYLKDLSVQILPHLHDQNIFPQGPFLKNLGIDIRAQMLIQSNPKLKKIFEEALFRLTDSSQMGSLFKIFKLHNP
ncbi:MAG: SAM-dependent methyltransferase [Proteobacteria bacterium]|nr:SAM-dependent methyltransferase [Pseudomonadota bacterium]